MEEENHEDKQSSGECPAEPVDLAKKLIDTLIEERDDQTFAEIVKWMESHLAALNLSGDATPSVQDVDQNEDDSSPCGDVTVDLDINGHQYHSASSIEPISDRRSGDLTPVDCGGDNLDSAEEARGDRQSNQSKNTKVNQIFKSTAEEKAGHVNFRDNDDTDQARSDYDERITTFLARGSKRKAVNPIRINGPTSSLSKETVETSSMAEEMIIPPTSPPPNGMTVPGNGVKVEVPSLSSCESNGLPSVNHQHKISVSLQSSHDDPAQTFPAVMNNTSQYSHSSIRQTKTLSDNSSHYHPLSRNPIPSALRNSSITGESTRGVMLVGSSMLPNGYNTHKNGTGTLSVYNNGNLSDAVNQSVRSHTQSLGPLRTSRLNGDAIKDVPLEYVTPEGKRQYRCPVCMNNYANRSGLNRHYITHSPDDLWKAECHICGKKYSRKDSLKHHIKTQHHPIHSGNLSCRGRCHGGMFSLMNGKNEGLLPRSNSCPMDDYMEDHAPTKMPRLQFSTTTDDEIPIDEDNNSCANTLANTVFDRRKNSECTAEVNEMINEEDSDQNGSCGGVSATFGASFT